MSDQETPQDNAPPSEESAAPAVPSSTTEETPGEESSNRSLMIVLSYLWILFLIPLLAEKDDKVVQWHAKHGLVLTVAEMLLHFVLYAVTATGIGCIFAVLIPVVMVGFVVIRVICIVKGINGERFMIPGISQYADKF